MAYEMHITVEPQEKMSYETFTELSSYTDWKTSKFDHDDVDGIAGKWFLTSHADTEQGARDVLAGMVHGMACSGFEIARCKIEHIVFDTKRGDVL